MGKEHLPKNRNDQDSYSGPNPKRKNIYIGSIQSQKIEFVI